MSGFGRFLCHLGLHRLVETGRQHGVYGDSTYTLVAGEPPESGVAVTKACTRAGCDEVHEDWRPYRESVL